MIEYYDKSAVQHILNSVIFNISDRHFPSADSYYASRDTAREIKKEIDKLPAIKIGDEESPAQGDLTYAIYNREEVIPNCTVQVLHNTVTGAYSIGWFRDGTPDE